MSSIQAAYHFGQHAAEGLGQPAVYRYASRLYNAGSYAAAGATLAGASSVAIAPILPYVSAAVTLYGAKQVYDGIKGFF